MESTKKSPPTENTPRNPHQLSDRDHLETAREKHGPRVSPYSPDSIDPELVEIGHVQLSQSVKTTNVTHTLTRHTQTDGQADKLNNGTLYAPQYEEAFLPDGKKRLGRFAPSALPYYNFRRTRYNL